MIPLLNEQISKKMEMFVPFSLIAFKKCTKAEFKHNKCSRITCLCDYSCFNSSRLYCVQLSAKRRNDFLSRACVVPVAWGRADTDTVVLWTTQPWSEIMRWGGWPDPREERPPEVRDPLAPNKFCCLHFLIRYQLVTPWSRVLLEKLRVRSASQ
jgi:hypothetical protein